MLMKRGKGMVSSMMRQKRKGGRGRGKGWLRRVRRQEERVMRKYRMCLDTHAG
jgi:hypothetical protein